MNTAKSQPENHYCGTCGWSFNADGQHDTDRSALARSFRQFTLIAKLSAFECRLLQVEVAVEAFQDDILIEFLRPMRALNERDLMTLYARAYGGTLREAWNVFENRKQKWSVDAALPATHCLTWPMQFPVGLGRLGDLVEVLRASYATSAELAARLVADGLVP